jgi:2-polyprenyl-3-methyl-5-hydroxy-6-metoxy-1,4-benzoquinol methylase
MAKLNEQRYFKEIGQDGIEFTLHKPFSDPINSGGLLTDIGAVLTQLPPPPARILDLGCGSGWTSNFYAQAGYTVVGVDIAPEAVKAAKQHFKSPNLTFVCSDYDGLKFDEEFDAAIFFDSLHHSDDELLPLQKAFQALKPGGLIVLNEPGKGHSKSPSSIEAVQKYGVSERDMPPKISRKALARSGFVDIHTYAYPALINRIAYKNRSTKAYMNLSIIRGILLLLLATVLKRDHGLVTAHKK